MSATLNIFAGDIPLAALGHSDVSLQMDAVLNANKQQKRDKSNRRAEELLSATLQFYLS